MSEYGHHQPQWHAITDSRFVCTAPPDAPCRDYPTCECLVWVNHDDPSDCASDPDHCCCDTTRKLGQPCWIEPWINNSVLSDSYDGPAICDDEGDPILPDGPVLTEFTGDAVLWRYADANAPLPA